jgi:uncharacterized protein YdeI (YjbR/CyaY-like superfamily)
MNSKVDAYLRKAKKWQEEMGKLRSLLLDSPLTEEFKWAKPCYTFQDSNVAILCGLKESCAIGFMKGALLKDAQGVLVKPGENSQSMRWMKFTSAREIAERKPIVKAYIEEAVAAEKAGVKINFKKNPGSMPEELQKKLKENRALKTAFEALTPGRQRGYILYFSAAKQSETRESRIEKYTPHILKGLGMLDEYRVKGGAV